MWCVPRLAILSCIWRAARPHGQHDNDGSHADDNPQHGQYRTLNVAPKRTKCNAASHDQAAPCAQTRDISHGHLYDTTTQGFEASDLDSCVTMRAISARTASLSALGLFEPET